MKREVAVFRFSFEGLSMLLITVPVEKEGFGSE